VSHVQRFVRRLNSGIGGGVFPKVGVPRFSVQTDGVSWLTAADVGGTRYAMPAIGSGNVTTIGVWVNLHSLLATQRIVQIGNNNTPTGDVATIVAVIDYAAFNGHFRAVASSGAFFTALNSTLSPLADTWYFIGAGFGDGAIGMTIWDTTHQIESSSVGLIVPGYNPIANPPLGALAAPDGQEIMAAGGRIDSLAVWPNTAIPSLGPIWNNGHAENFNEVPAAFLPPKLKLWADFNEPSGSASYLDATGVGNLTAHGVGLTRQIGAGF